jgi:hypothetical protein
MVPDGHDHLEHREEALAALDLLRGDVELLELALQYSEVLVELEGDGGALEPLLQARDLRDNVG